MRYLDEDLYIDIDFGRGESDPVHYRESGTFEIQVSEMYLDSWETIFKGTFNKTIINRQIPLRFYINDFIRKTDVIDLSGYTGSMQEYPSALYKYRVVATSVYGDTQTSNPIEVYPAYRNIETLSQMPYDQFGRPMSIIRQPMVPRYPVMLAGYDPCILIYRSKNAPDLKPDEGLYFADSKGLIQLDMSTPFNSLRGRSYFKDVWYEINRHDPGVRKVLSADKKSLETIEVTPGIVNPKYVFVRYTFRYVLEDAFFMDKCPRDYYLYWIDRYGGVQCQPLRQNYKQTQNYTRESTENLINETHDYLNNVQTSFTFNTDWINKQEMAVWESIMVSPMVCLIDTRAQRCRRVLVTDKSFSQKTFDNTHTLFNMTFNVKLAKTQQIYL